MLLAGLAGFTELFLELSIESVHVFIFSQYKQAVTVEMPCGVLEAEWHCGSEAPAESTWALSEGCREEQLG